jgi:hypothetical protein
MRFEMSSGETYSEVLSDKEKNPRNVSLLQSRHYPTVMQRRGKGYFLHGKDHSLITEKRSHV